jgi:DNA repair exonuclease SbcCD ATPase subunit
MIFKSLTLHNFLSFKGENTIHFPTPKSTRLRS